MGLDLESSQAGAQRDGAEAEDEDEREDEPQRIDKRAPAGYDALRKVSRRTLVSEPEGCWQEVAGGVTAPLGFRAAATRCGIKQAETDDLGLLVAEPGGCAAAVFTRNRVSAAPVRWSRDILPRGKVRAAVVNSGNANACTGERGLEDAAATATAAAGALGLEPDQFLVASTGIIGRFLPMDKLLAGIPQAAAALDASIAAGDRFARAILTTDTVP